MAKRVGIDRDAVVRAAAKIADDEGWDALTLARVAGKLRVRSPSLYNHVGGLEDLRRELKLLVMHELNTALTRATIGKSRDDAVRALAAAYRAFVKRHMTLDESAIGRRQCAHRVVARFADGRASESRIELVHDEEFELAAQVLEAADVIVERGRADAQFA